METARISNLEKGLIGGSIGSGIALFATGLAVSSLAFTIAGFALGIIGIVGGLYVFIREHNAQKISFLKDYAVNYSGLDNFSVSSRQPLLTEQKAD
jgi:hypothetical protein